MDATKQERHGFHGLHGFRRVVPIISLSPFSPELRNSAENGEASPKKLQSSRRLINAAFAPHCYICQFPIHAPIGNLALRSSDMGSTVNAERSRQGDQTQRERERIFRVMADAAPVMIWMCSPDKQYTYFNERWLDFTGCPVASELGTGWTGGVHPDDLQRCLSHSNEKFDLRQEFTLEYRLRRHDGEFCRVSATAVPLFSAGGSFAGYVGWCFDLAGHKRAAEAVSTVNARLIEAQERERIRIARELHDDIGASLVLLGIELLRAEKPVSGSRGRVHPGNHKLYEKMQEIANRASRLSSQLHSPALEYMGLAKAIEIECREFTAGLRIPVTCSCRNVPAKMDQAVGLNCIRVVQEALHNAAQHGGAARVEVQLTATPALLTLLVRDNGTGFDVEQGRLAPGVGLISMRERMRQVGGEFEIRSQPGRGTEVVCRVPLENSPATQRSPAYPARPERRAGNQA
jgi:PAS domain S-box-containing protein